MIVLETFPSENTDTIKRTDQVLCVDDKSGWGKRSCGSRRKQVCLTSLQQSDRNLRGPHVARRQQLSINICSAARARPQQHTRRPPVLSSIDMTDIRTDGRTLDRFMTLSAYSGTSAGFRLGGQCSLAAWGEFFFWKFGYEMVHKLTEVYLNKYVVSIAPFSTPACPDCSQNIT